MDCLTLKKSNCKNCYKCIRHCPVKAIRFSGNQAHIIGDECILCGHCFVVCPQNAKEIVNETEKARVLINSGDPVYVSLAPSFIANYEGVGIGAMRDALKQLGFADVEETALGATVVKNEYERLLREEKRDIVISSCCHTVNLLIQKYFPNELPYLADVLSPMQAHCADIKKRHPGAKTVFIGPCVAKKDEASHYQGIVDAVLTYEELTEWLNKEGITLKHEVDDTEESRARFFPTTGGILKTMSLDAPTTIWRLTASKTAFPHSKTSSKAIYITPLSRCRLALAVAWADRLWKNTIRRPSESISPWQTMRARKISRWINPIKQR